MKVDFPTLLIIGLLSFLITTHHENNKDDEIKVNKNVNQ